ncbi:hypothetical protein NP233_g7725 [Leucocoprinus birnbaumii]|uniref:Uncharacterized protein n=1 Tax=Leucocoprinus birnbaumii TaxID=56174 RepID=A0AAD5VNM1_9AGAR|nr:hypothetical protein NP233_g7725 [Leucocoprinus birnbaumii]
MQRLKQLSLADGALFPEADTTTRLVGAMDKYRDMGRQTLLDLEVLSIDTSHIASKTGESFLKLVEERKKAGLSKLRLEVPPKLALSKWTKAARERMREAVREVFQLEISVDGRGMPI